MVCPLSVMANWEEQIKEHLKGLEALETDNSDAGVKREEGKAAGKAAGKGKKKEKGKGGIRVAIYHGKDRGALKLQALQVQQRCVRLLACVAGSEMANGVLVIFSHPPQSHGRATTWC